MLFLKGLEKVQNRVPVYFLCQMKENVHWKETQSKKKSNSYDQNQWKCDVKWTKPFVQSEMGENAIKMRGSTFKTKSIVRDLHTSVAFLVNKSFTIEFSKKNHLPSKNGMFKKEIQALWI